MAFANTSTKFEVWGRSRVNLYAGATFNTGDTLVVGMNSVKQVIPDAPSTTTDVTYTVANTTPGPGQSTVTLTVGSPVTGTGINIAVIGN